MLNNEENIRLTPAQGHHGATVEDPLWGETIGTFDLDFDGARCVIVKYHPWISKRGKVYIDKPDKTRVLFYNTETSWSDRSMQASVLRWMTRKNLGLNQHALVEGVCKALNVPGFEIRNSKRN